MPDKVIDNLALGTFSLQPYKLEKVVRAAKYFPLFKIMFSNEHSSLKLK